MKRYTITLTALEVIGLSRVAGEGAEGLFTDDLAAAGYIGNGHAVAAAKRAVRKLDNVASWAVAERRKQSQSTQGKT